MTKDCMPFQSCQWHFLVQYFYSLYLFFWYVILCWRLFSVKSISLRFSAYSYKAIFQIMMLDICYDLLNNIITWKMWRDFELCKDILIDSLFYKDEDFWGWKYFLGLKPIFSAMQHLNCKQKFVLRSSVS